jgi:ABC-type transporter Mla subunit MlaD
MEAMVKFSNRKEPQVDGPRAKIDFAKLADDIGREDTQRVSEYAPLRERVDQAARLNMQEAADAANAMITDIQELVKTADVRHAQMHRSSEQVMNAIQQALQQHNAEIVRHSDEMAHICAALDQIRGVASEAQPPATNSKPKSEPEDDHPKDAA